MELNPKIVDMTLIPLPRPTRSGFEVHAEFTLLVFPLRIVGCKLVKTPRGSWTVWTPDPAVKLNKAALGELTMIVQSEHARAAERVAA